MVPPALRWRPFLLGPIFKEMGLTTSPFVTWPTRGAYMWRDLERLAAAHDLPFRRPSRFPQNGLWPARVATAHEKAPWLPAFVTAVYRAEFAEDRDIGQRDTVTEVLTQLGVDADGVLAAAASPSTKASLRAATAEAQAAGIFGAPSFTVGGELFWGQDRLDEALRWAEAPR